MPIHKTINEHKVMMEKALEHLQVELKAVRTGRASTGIVDHLKVDYYGSPTPLLQLATISTPEPAMVVIKPFDPASTKEIEKAIRNSDLSLAPVNDGKVIRLNLPPLSQERRNQLAAQVKQFGEQAKVSVRNIRRDANKKLDDEQKAKTLTEDDRDKGKKNIDELTKQFSEKIDTIVKNKAEEIMSD